MRYYLRIATLFWAFLPSSGHGHQAGTRYGAIAFSPITGRSATFVGASTAEAAKAGAIAQCAHPDCHWIVLVRNGFAALAVGEGAQLGWAFHSDRATASREALRSCAKLSRNCVLKAEVSVEDRPAKLESTAPATRPTDRKSRSPEKSQSP